ncbi:glycosyltransferase family 1 protein [Halomonas sp. YLB-10]|uniref:glycosyltransferase n=1 Tax=Halomonas sp. YLB-10 TaxID=2483111 RepID=UPI000F5DCCE6|nr:glycosyltransferase [Halomonas sp. YLB-10]RQW70852.1 glycosyltransferase family 1 protein [Halomonas sp. YLB-10]
MSLLRRISHFFKLDVYVAYLGDFSFQIGPPSSMKSLSELLSEIYKVEVTNNLRKKIESTNENSQNDAVAAGKSNTLWRFNIKKKAVKYARLYCFLRILRFFVLLLLFNLKCNFLQLVNKGLVVVITQPFYFPIINRGHVVYIRRANEPLGKVLEKGVKGYLEKRFYDWVVKRVVYLVPINRQSPGCVIPNHFDVENHYLNYPSAMSSLHVTGTWNYRKGADRVASVIENLPFQLRSRACVYGGLGLDDNINELVVSLGDCYKGIVAEPFKHYVVGDIFLSLSRLEGFQRSMAEALLQGCLVVAVSRPDSRYIEDYPGVFIVDKGKEFSFEECAEFIEELFSMPIEERVTLGEKNRERAIEDMGRDSILAAWKSVLDDVMEQSND